MAANDKHEQKQRRFSSDPPGVGDLERNNPSFFQKMARRLRNWRRASPRKPRESGERKKSGAAISWLLKILFWLSFAAACVYMLTGVTVVNPFWEKLPAFEPGGPARTWNDLKQAFGALGENGPVWPPLFLRFTGFFGDAGTPLLRRGESWLILAALMWTARTFLLRTARDKAVLRNLAGLLLGIVVLAYIGSYRLSRTMSLPFWSGVADLSRFGFAAATALWLLIVLRALTKKKDKGKKRSLAGDLFWCTVTVGLLLLAAFCMTA